MSRVEESRKMRYVCPKCGDRLTRERGMYAWRGVILHGWTCNRCHALCDVSGAFINYVLKISGVPKEKRKRKADEASERW